MTDVKSPYNACEWTLHDRRYYTLGKNKVFMKRTLRPSEWKIDSENELKSIRPISLRYRMRNEAANLEFLADKGIAVPTLLGIFEADDATYLLTEFVSGESMSHLEDAEKKIVQIELDQHIAKLKTLKSTVPGVPGTTYVVPHHRTSPTGEIKMLVWTLKPDTLDECAANQEEYVFCHNDLGQHNVLVDPTTLKIKAIIDWEFSGFFPTFFDPPYWKERGAAPELEDDHLRKEWFESRYEPSNITWPDEIFVATGDEAIYYMGSCMNEEQQGAKWAAEIEAEFRADNETAALAAQEQTTLDRVEIQVPNVSSKEERLCRFCIICMALSLGKNTIGWAKSRFQQLFSQSEEAPGETSKHIPCPSSKWKSCTESDTEDVAELDIQPHVVKPIAVQVLSSETYTAPAISEHANL